MCKEAVRGDYEDTLVGTLLKNLACGLSGPIENVPEGSGGRELDPYFSHSQTYGYGWGVMHEGIEWYIKDFCFN